MCFGGYIVSITKRGWSIFLCSIILGVSVIGIDTQIVGAASGFFMSAATSVTGFINKCYFFGTRCKGIFAKGKQLYDYFTQEHKDKPKHDYIDNIANVFSKSSKMIKDSLEIMAVAQRVYFDYCTTKAMANINPEQLLVQYMSNANRKNNKGVHVGDNTFSNVLRSTLPTSSRSVWYIPRD